MRTKLIGFAIVVISLCTSAQAQVKLAFKHTEGTTIIADNSLLWRQVTKTGPPSPDIETTSTFSTVVTSEIGRRATDGTLTIESRIEEVHSGLIFGDEAAENQMNYSFNSKIPLKARIAPQFEPTIEFLKVLSKSAWATTLDKDNRIVSVAYHGNPAELVSTPFKSQFDAERRQRKEAQELARFPDHAVQPGESWVRMWSQDFGSGTQLTFQNRYTYVGTVQHNGKTLEKITSTADPKTATPIKSGSAGAELELKLASAEGTILFDRQRGLIAESSGAMRLVGTQKMTFDGKEVVAQMEQTMEFKSAVRP